MSYFNKTSLLGGIDNYANSAPTETYAKKSVVSTGANANLLINSRDRNNGRVLGNNTQPFNDFVIQKGFPLLQGQINSLMVDEIRFPMPPNITDYNNGIVCYIYDTNGNIVVGSYVGVNIGNGFYTGTQLATTLTQAFASIVPTVTITYNRSGQFVATVNLTGYGGIGFAPYLASAPVPGTVVGVKALWDNVPPEQQGLIWTMGFNNYIFNSYAIPVNPVNPAVNNTYILGQANMLYTTYIDIASDVLTQYQDLTDTSSDNTNPRHIICRLYIADEVSVPLVDASGNPVLPGTLYTVIHRQFKNPKVIKWNGQNSIDRIDIRLYDDLGRFLWTLPNSAIDFQLTFSAVEL